MRQPRGSKQTSLDREQRAWELTKQCWTQESIAEELGVTQSAVSHMLKRAEKRFLKGFSERIEAEKARQTARLEFILEEAVQAWRRSKQDAETIKTVEEQVEIEGRVMEAQETKRERTVKGQSGNPALLSEAQKALAGIRGIWGIDAPTATTTTWTLEPFHWTDDSQAASDAPSGAEEGGE